MRFGAILITCEHGGNQVPARWRARFRGAGAVLSSHRGWDPGALGVARTLAKALGAPLVFAETSRLLVELNRSAHHPKLFSEFTRDLPPAEKAAIVAAHYAPYRAEVEAHVSRALRRGPGPVLHLSSHSFTPVLDGAERAADAGLLYDPRRPLERAFAAALTEELRATGELRVRRNYPYRGVGDGLTTHLRRRFSANKYVGLELEMNQALEPRAYARLLVAALQIVLSA